MVYFNNVTLLYLCKLDIIYKISKSKLLYISVNAQP